VGMWGQRGGQEPGTGSAQGPPPYEWFRNSTRLWIFPWWVPGRVERK